jgi:hypothetical protein
MNESLIRKTNLFGAWCGVFYCVLLLLGWWVVGGFFPLHEPSAGAEEIAAFYRGDNLNRMRAGLVMVMWGAAIFMPFTATMAHFVARIEGCSGPLTRITQMSGYSNALLTFYPPLYWLANAFRPHERSAELIWMINDIAWLQFIGGISMAMFMFVSVGVAILNDKSATPVFPRWMVFFSLLVFVLFFPDQLLFFFKTGPFAWNGLFAFWIPLSLFCGWFLLMFYFMRRALLRTAQSPSSQPGIGRDAAGALH